MLFLSLWLLSLLSTVSVSSDGRYEAGSISLAELHSDLEVWLLLHKAQVEQVVLQTPAECSPYTGWSCVKPLVDIEQGETVLSIPRTLMLTAELGQNTATGRAMKASSSSRQAFYAENLGVMYLHVLLAEHRIAMESGEAAFFHPFYSIMLDTFPVENFPLFWNAAELSCLKGSNMLTYLDMNRETISSEYSCICEDYPRFADRCSLDDYKVIWSYVRASAFTMTSSSSITTVGLVPILDAIQSSDSGEGNVEMEYDPKSEAYIVRSTDSISRGSVLTKAQDPLNNHKLLLTFGTCNKTQSFFWGTLHENNMRESFFLRVLRLLLNSDSDEDQVTLAEDALQLYGPVLSELTIASREARFAQNADNTQNAHNALDWTEIKGVFKDIERITLSYLDQYPSKFECKGTGITAINDINKGHAQVLVSEEKRALRHILSIARSALSLLHSPTFDSLQKLLHELKTSSDSLVFTYFERVLVPLITARLLDTMENNNAQESSFGASPFFSTDKNDKVLSSDEFKAQYDLCTEDWENCEEVLVEVELAQDREDVAAIIRQLL